MSYLTHYKNPIDLTIKARTSCRTYQNKLLDEKDKAPLLSFLSLMSKGLQGEKNVFHLVEVSAEALKEKKIADYGLFKNVRSCIVGVIDKSEMHLLSYGYLMEHVVLKATELGLGACWAGYFTPYLTDSVKVAENQTIPAICLVGYPAETRPLKERLVRFAVRASKRKNWENLFFLHNFQTQLPHDATGPYTEPLELLRLAPSSGNTQPWRIVKEKDRHVYHFFKKVINARYETRGLHDIDIGIAMCHFELGAEKNKLQGRWERIRHRIEKIPTGMSYMMSWH